MADNKQLGALQAAMALYGKKNISSKPITNADLKVADTGSKRSRLEETINRLKKRLRDPNLPPQERAYLVAQLAEAESEAENAAMAEAAAQKPAAPRKKQPSGYMSSGTQAMPVTKP